MFLANTDKLYTYMSNIYTRINDLKSYKDYESIDFQKPLASIDKLKLRDFLISEKVYREANPETRDKLFEKTDAK